MEEEEEENRARESTRQRQHTTLLTTTSSNNVSAKKLTLIPLIFLIYFEVAGGPFGEEPAVAAAGPLCAILGFLIFPFIWSVPEALITAELATTFPGDGGFVIWTNEAFGPFWASAMGFTKFLSGVINSASFPLLFVDYLKKLFPIFSSGFHRSLVIFIFTISMSFLNYTGLSIVGYTSVLLGLISLSPFVLTSLISIPKIEPHRWLDWGNKNKDWNLFFNTLFWNLNFWDNVSTIAGEVERPHKIFPVALLSSVVLTCLAYMIPLLAITGSVSVHQDQWSQGFYADAAEIIAGKWLQIWIEIGATLSAVGLYEAQLSSCAYGLLGMADLGFLPRFFANRCSRFGTPWVGILLSTVITLAVSYMNFTDIISSANFLYSMGMLLEFASFVWLRIKSPEIKRPYRVPMKIPGLLVMCLVPSAFLIYIMVIATKTVFLASGLMMAAVIGMYFLVRLCKSKELFRFNNGNDLH